MLDMAVQRLCARSRQGWKFDCDWHLLAPAQPPYELSTNWCSQWGSESGFLDGSKQPPPTFQVTITSSTCIFKLGCFAYVTGNVTSIWKIPRESSTLSTSPSRDRKQNADASEAICYPILFLFITELYFANLQTQFKYLNGNGNWYKLTYNHFVRFWFGVRKDLQVLTSLFVSKYKNYFISLSFQFLCFTNIPKQWD